MIDSGVVSMLATAPLEEACWALTNVTIDGTPAQIDYLVQCRSSTGWRCPTSKSSRSTRCCAFAALRLSRRL
jgi:hypothetical protein